MKPACPTEDMLKLLISEAFKDLVPADPGRVSHIGSRLVQQIAKRAEPKNRFHQQWLFWLLIGGAVTASAFWVSDRIQQTTAPVTVQKAIPTKPQPTIVEQKPASSSTNEKDSNTTEQRNTRQGPIIYQREEY